ncbi:hypothetical protein ACLH9T_004739 [Salmonella enterica]|nr:hypothetical protein [Salmonella enterica]EBG5027107.1 hypothetical protein [Salmonella enterica subsp. enterica serovar Oranienburg]ECK2142547.1 hypothetical protein [Salmonella enterica subsp. enterica serovar Enteritidis]EBB1607294.1 hypothetical protein [Salmonella enterica]EBB9533725.1 hypothetical protein [Salmonella enterica]
MPEGERTYHGLNLPAKNVRFNSSRWAIQEPDNQSGGFNCPWHQYQVEKPLNGFMQPGSNCPGRTPSTALHGVIYNIDISAAIKNSTS